jgi:heme exporter protein C
VTTELVPNAQPAAARRGARRSEASVPTGTGSQTTRVLGIILLVALPLWAFLALVGTPLDAVQGTPYRLIFLHVPVVVSAYLATAVGAVASGMWLWKRTEWWDVLASSAVEIAAVFTAATLVSGAIWGGASWGVLWVWDARVTSTALLFLLQLGYLAVRRIPASVEARGTRSAVIGLLLLPNLVIINQAVNWWRSVHQAPTILNPNLTEKRGMEGQMAFTFVYSMAVAAVLVTWLMIHRFRVGWLADRVEEQGLEDALAERRREVS